MKLIIIFILIASCQSQVNKNRDEMRLLLGESERLTKKILVLESNRLLEEDSIISEKERIVALCGNAKSEFDLKYADKESKLSENRMRIFKANLDLKYQKITKPFKDSLSRINTKIEELKHINVR